MCILAGRNDTAELSCMLILADMNDTAALMLFWFL